MPTGFGATGFADGSLTLPFLELFGRRPHDGLFESQRDIRLYLRQTLCLLSLKHVQSEIDGNPRFPSMLQGVSHEATARSSVPGLALGAYRYEGVCL